jgi:hypothetical protein
MLVRSACFAFVQSQLQKLGGVTALGAWCSEVVLKACRKVHEYCETLREYVSHMCAMHVYIGVAAEDCSFGIAIRRLVLVIVASTKLQQFERPAEPDRAPAQNNHRRETINYDEGEDICLVSRELCG